MRSQWWDGLKADHARLWSAVVLVLGLVEKDGPAGKRQDLDDDETIALYVKDCADSALTPDMVWSARDDVRHRSEYFPRPGQFARLVSEHVRDNWRALSSVVTEDGLEKIAIRYVSPDSTEWREHVEALVRAQEGQQALPSPELRGEAMARVERILENPPVRRMPEARERAGFVDEPDPEAQARRRAMVEELRKEGVV